MHRLAGYFHRNDDQCLEPAMAVALWHPIDLDPVGEWRAGELATEKFDPFRGKLNAWSRGGNPIPGRV